MTVDRRASDPLRPAPPPEPSHGCRAQDGAGLPSGLDTMWKPDFVALAEQRGLDTSGTRADLIARLRETS